MIKAEGPSGGPSHRVAMIPLSSAAAMNNYQCLFFTRGVIAYWENIDGDSDIAAHDFLTRHLQEGEWDAAEAWESDRLACRVEASLTLLSIEHAGIC